MSNQKYEQGILLFNQGLSLTKISRELGISRKWFTEFLKEKGIDTNSRPNKYDFNREYFKTVDNEEKAYWLGFLLADGCIVETIKNGKVKGMVLELSLCEKDLNHIKTFCNAIGLDETAIKKKIVTLNGSKIPVYRVSVCSTEICRDLIAKGVTPRKSYTASISDEFTKSKFLRHIVRGIFDGDGHIIKNGTHNHGVAITSASGKLLIQLKLLFTKLGCDDVEIVTNRFPTLELRYFNQHDDKVILDYLYKDAQIYLTRKYETYIARSYRNVGTGGGKNGETLRSCG